MKGNAKQTVNRPVSHSLKQLEPESDTYVRSLTPIPATARSYVGLAERIATEQLRQVDELSLIGYPTSWDEQTRDVVYATLRLAAERVLDA